jgi:4-amino-4-deoxy-L-arabinose transferase-like glycosyltransferase
VVDYLSTSHIFKSGNPIFALMIERILQHPLILFLCIAFIYLLAIPVDIMEVDSAQYYSMSVEMLHRGNFLEFYDRGKEYLDKPPFIFWISGLFFSIFGANEFAFKLPSILFSVLGMYATYRFTKLYYSDRTAMLAALILGSTQGYFHFNNDVRTDTYLTNSVIASTWMLAAFIQNKKWYYWIGGFFFAGIAMLAKGPMGLISPILAFGTHILFKNEWKVLLRWQWLAGFVVIGAVLSPMLIGLYQQFDLQPDKIVNGKTGVSGLRFYFWEQSFGRITGENVWKNDTGPFFFVHNLGWSFLPWTLAFFGAFFMLIKDSIANGARIFSLKKEWITWGGFLLPFIALSMSKYKLPHYIYVTFPFAAVITADYLEQLRTRLSPAMKWLNISQTVVLAGAWGFGGLIFLWFFPLTNPILIAVALGGLLLFLYAAIVKFNGYLDKWMVMSISTSFAINILMACQFYPSIIEYQASGKAAKYAVEQKIPLDRLFVYFVNGRSLDVYTNHVQKECSDESLMQEWQAGNQSLFVFTNREGRQKLTDGGWKSEAVFTTSSFAVSLLTMNFGNPNTREKVLDEAYILKVSR